MAIEKKISEVTKIDSVEETWIELANRGKSMTDKELENLRGPVSGPVFDNLLSGARVERKEGKFIITKPNPN